MGSLNYADCLHEKYGEDLRILAFPCNQFARQEPCDESQIKNFAKSYGVQFDLFSKVAAKML